MRIVYLFAALLGAAATIAFLVSDGLHVALRCAPFGGSALTLLVAVSVDAPRAGRRPAHNADLPDTLIDRNIGAAQARWNAEPSHS